MRQPRQSDGAGRTGSEADSGHRNLIAPVALATVVVLLTAGLATAAALRGGHSTVRAAQSPGSSYQVEGGSQLRPRPAPPTTSTTAPVAPAGVHRDPSALLTLPAPVTGAQLAAIAALRGVDAVEVVDIGTVGLQGGPAKTIGVNPDSFRNFTPKASADSDRLWQYISSGTLASSFEMSRDRQLPLGAEVQVSAAAPVPAPAVQEWLGAFMSVGLPGVDLVVSQRLSSHLGLAPRSGLVVSAPAADPYDLQTAVIARIPGASVVLMRPGLGLGSLRGGGGGAATPSQLSTALTAAVSRVGKPYVWGGTGPNGFDCSGLVGWSFAAAGIDLPRTAAEQALAGPSVAISRIQPGDLLFWAYDPADPSFVDHVAIYLGQGQMVEAPQTGSAVHVIPVPFTHLVGAVRVNPVLAARLGSPWRR